ncbi:hypothetical protein B0T14DRAFT_566999 [Immersiella caudata]|uniref:Uncharacterized protein n=1 Tax=Immersiella caudata TaxID=314043 RepID=A0AA39WRG2_9PEZI|nr:hypothetical protein B0T14DRAFT_566999 [Immersiella caudata]
MDATPPEDDLHLRNLLTSLNVLSTEPPISPAHSLLFPNPTHHPSNPLPLHPISSHPILSAFLFASTATGAAPTYFNVRHFVLLSVLFGWLASRFISFLLTKHLNQHLSLTKHKRTHVIVCAVKNVTLGLVPPFLLATQTCGCFSNCRPWPPIRLDGEVTGVELNPREKFDWNNAVLYSPLVGAFLAWI